MLRHLLRSLVLATPLLVACGGGVPLLHPAHALKPGVVSTGVGASGHFVFGDVDAAIAEAEGSLAAPGAPGTPTIARGVAASVLGAPGVAPWIGARVGVAPSTEAGLYYTGRFLRVDGRYSFENAAEALSTGLGFKVLLTHPTTNPNHVDDNGALSGVDTGAVRGFGVDLPLIVGYRSAAELIQVWAGVRGSFDHAFGDVLFPSSGPSGDMVRARLDADAFSGEALLGLAVGLHPVWVAAELSAGYLRANGRLTPEGLSSSGTSGASGFMLTPAAALIGRF